MGGGGYFRTWAGETQSKVILHFWIFPELEKYLLEYAIHLFTNTYFVTILTYLNMLLWSSVSVEITNF